MKPIRVMGLQRFLEWLSQTDEDQRLGGSRKIPRPDCEGDCQGVWLISEFFRNKAPLVWMIMLNVEGYRVDLVI